MPHGFFRQNWQNRFKIEKVHITIKFIQVYSISTKFLVKLAILDFWAKLIQKWYFRSKKRVIISIEFYIFEISYNQFHNILRLFHVYQIFLSLKVERSTIITCTHGIYELPHELPNNLKLRILGNQKMSRKCLNFIESQPSAQSPCQNESFVNTSRKLLKNRN